MKKILLILFVLWSAVSVAQVTPTGYLFRNTNERVRLQKPDGFTLPAKGDTTFLSGQYLGAGATVVDTTGSNKGLYVWYDGYWHQVGSGATKANNGLSASGDTMQLGGTLYKNTYIRARRPFVSGLPTSQLIIGNTSQDSSLHSETGSPLQGTDYGGPLVVIVKQFNEAWGDTLMPDYGAVLVVTQQERFDSTSTRFAAGNQDIIFNEAGNQNTHGFIPPRDSVDVLTSPFGRHGGNFSSNLAIGGTWGYKFNVKSPEVGHGINGFRSTADLDASLAYGRAKQMTGNGLALYEAEYKAYQRNIVTTDPYSYWNKIIGFKFEGDIYDYIGASVGKAATLAVATVDTVVGFDVPAIYTPTNTVKNAYSFRATGDSDMLYHRGKARFGGSMPASKDIEFQVEVESSLMIKNGELRLRANPSSFPGVAWQNLAGTFLGGVYINSVGNSHYEIRDSTKAIVLQIGDGSGAKFPVSLTNRRVTMTVDSMRLIYNTETFPDHTTSDLTGYYVQVRRASDGTIKDYTGSIGGSATTIYNGDDALTSDRTVDGDANDLFFTDMEAFRIYGTGGTYGSVRLFETSGSAGTITVGRSGAPYTTWSDSIRTTGISLVTDTSLVYVQTLNKATGAWSYSPWLHAGGGGGTPGGSDTYMQYNDGGAFGGDAGATYNETTNTLTLTGSLNLPSSATEGLRFGGTLRMYDNGSHIRISPPTGSLQLFTSGSTGTLSVFNSGGSNSVVVDGTGVVYRSSSPLQLQTTGNVGIGTGGTSASARLHLPGGGTGAGTAPQKFTAGSLLTTIEAFAKEANANGTYQTSNALNRYAEGGYIADFYTEVNNVTTTETDLYSYTTKANTFAADGEKLIAEFTGTTTGHATATRTWQIYFGGSSISTSASFFTGIDATGLEWKIKVTGVRRSSSSIVWAIEYTVGSSGVTAVVDVAVQTGLTLSGTNVLKLTGQAGGTGAGSDQIKAQSGTISWYGASNN